MEDDTSGARITGVSVQCVKFSFIGILSVVKLVTVQAKPVVPQLRNCDQMGCDRVSCQLTFIFQGSHRAFIVLLQSRTCESQVVILIFAPLLW